MTSSIFGDLTFWESLVQSVVENDRWKMYLEGMGNTLLMTFGAAIVGILIGSLVAICKIYSKQNKKLKFFDVICDIYITIIRGTPMAVQLLIAWYIIFASAGSGAAIIVAIIAFGFNSGAYVAEIIRAGIQSVDLGQTEAGRSLGLTRNMTMWKIVFPQAVKNILPALSNEAIVLFKETAIVGLVAIKDLTFVASSIRSRTFNAMPLLVIALLYLIVVLIMTWGQKTLERRLSKSDRH